MLFNSIEFAIFLPIVFLLYWFVFNKKVKTQNLFILAVSYLFYGWWDWRFLLLIAFTSFCSWGSGMLIYQSDNPKRKKLINAANIIINLLILGLFKYYDFFAQTFADLFLNGKSDGILLYLILPVGISFYTFQALSYSIDIYHNKIQPTRDVVQFFAFVSFFPQLVAGPIERASNLLPQFERPRTFNYRDAAEGMRLILWGLFKKIVIADNCAEYVNAVFAAPDAHKGSTLILAAIFFSFQIYGDFSGYSDIAIGTAKLFGIRLMKNFNVPYFSRDIAEFWRRWHISLTTWFRDYLYIPLGGSRCSKAKVVRNTFVIFLVSGLWHGANWTFVVWGAFHALLFLPLILLGRNRNHRDTVAANRVLPSLKECGQMLLTFTLATIGWVIFRAESITAAWDYLASIPQDRLLSFPWLPSKTHYLVLVMCIVFMLAEEWNHRLQGTPLQLARIKSRVVRFTIYLILLALIALLNSGSGNQFIYFQF